MSERRWITRDLTNDEQVHLWESEPEYVNAMGHWVSKLGRGVPIPKHAVVLLTKMPLNAGPNGKREIQVEDIHK